ncbi:MAG: MgtC/SapB family protein [Acidobacteria bacterium]|nr:MgtC/SapB family protein [Acidobacteriota bacterium]
MSMIPFDLSAALHVAVATLAGLAVGIEREWSGHARGPSAHFAGIRTFTLLGLVAGVSGWLSTVGLTGLAVVLLGATGALVVAAYLAASRADVDGTTEVAAFVVLAAGVLAGLGYETAASGVTALTLLLLVEKRQLHGLVSRLDVVEIRAGARFAVMAAVVLPLLPEGPFGPLGSVRPRALWALVLFFSGLSFLGYVAQRIAGAGRGYAITGTLGGLVSSTWVTFTFARLSRHVSAHHAPPTGPALALGVMGANAMLFPRVLLASLVLQPALAAALWPAFVLPLGIGLLLVGRGLRESETAPTAAPPDQNPLRVGAALQMAVLFQVVLVVVTHVTARFGAGGLYASAVALGLTDVDALTVSMARLTGEATPAALTAVAVTLGVLTNTLVKLGITLTLGGGAFRARAAAGLALMAVSLAGALAWRLALAGP